jgi:hypothetical protein
MSNRNRNAFQAYKNTYHDTVRKRMQGVYNGNYANQVNRIINIMQKWFARPDIKTNHARTLYRGIKNITPIKNYINKGYVPNKSFSSWTNNKNVAKRNFSSNNNKSMILILKPTTARGIPYINFRKGKPPAYMPHNNRERESVLAPRVFRIGKPYRENGRTYALVTNIKKEIPPWIKKA